MGHPSSRASRHVREWLILLGALGILWSIHLAATTSNGLALPDATRERVGASADTVWSRFHAHFVAPLFHDGLAHIAYNSVLFAIALPIALRAFGAKAILFGYLASPIAGIAVDVLLILPMAKAGSSAAAEIAATRLVGASVIAFALGGMALVALWAKLGPLAFAIAAGVVVYEIILATLAITRPYIWAYHLTGFGVGAAMALAFRWTRSA